METLLTPKAGPRQGVTSLKLTQRRPVFSAVGEPERRAGPADVVGQDLAADRRGGTGRAFGAVAEAAGDADRGRRLGAVRLVLGIDQPPRVLGRAAERDGPLHPGLAVAAAAGGDRAGDGEEPL